jgi:pimeloyl-ACP methyl ester carboxylesterase
LLADRVVRVGALVTPAPSDVDDLDFFEGLADLNVKEFGAALEGREAIEAFLEPYVEGIRADADDVIEQILAELPEVDQRLASRPEFRTVMKESFTEAVRQGSRGWADDDLAFAKPWGFALEDVAVETRVWQGELDVLTPRPHGEYVASRLPNARFELLEGGGHFLDQEWTVVLDWLAGAGATA